MLARRDLPDNYRAWNNLWGAPYGRSEYPYRWLRGTRWDVRRKGAFAWQVNNSTREFEYPWAYFTASERGSRLTVVDLGGSLGGLQFVFAQEGHQVINVDPGLKAGGIGWDVSADTHARICRALDAPVSLRSDTLDRAGISDHSVDVLLSVSTLEHLSADDLDAVVRETSRILKPTGVVVITADLFLDLRPFTLRAENKWGGNVDIRGFLDRAGLVLRAGDTRELYGFPDFSTEYVLSELNRYHVGSGYPALAQCFVAGPGT